jgi:hypothetical protein
MCDRYSNRAMVERSKLNDVTPKDVKQLEILRPVNTASMGVRFKQSLEKEKRLEITSRPVEKQSDGKRKASNDANAAPPIKRVSNKKNKNKSVGNLDERALDQDDKVEEGIHWSDDEE